MGGCPKVLGMWAGFIYLFDCACMDQLILPCLMCVCCWFQTQCGVPPAVPLSVPPCPLYPHSLIHAALVLSSSHLAPPAFYFLPACLCHTQTDAPPHPAHNLSSGNWTVPATNGRIVCAWGSTDLVTLRRGNAYVARICEWRHTVCGLGDAVEVERRLYDAMEKGE